MSLNFLENSIIRALLQDYFQRANWTIEVQFEPGSVVLPIRSKTDIDRALLAKDQANRVVITFTRKKMFPAK